MHLAQYNIAEAIDSVDSSTLKAFFDNVERINSLADKSLGFVWRYNDDSGEDTFAIEAYQSEFILVNLSVWKDRDSLFQFVYQSDHLEIFRRKKEWFTKMPKMHMVLWYVEEDHIPSLQEAKERLEYLHEHGESEHAFTFRSKF